MDHRSSNHEDAHGGRDPFANLDFASFLAGWEPGGDEDTLPERLVDVHAPALVAEPRRKATGKVFYHPARDFVAFLLSGALIALAIGYLAMLIAWAAA